MEKTISVISEQDCHRVHGGVETSLAVSGSDSNISARVDVKTEIKDGLYIAGTLIKTPVETKGGFVIEFDFK